MTTKKDQKSLFRKLTRLFRSGPVVKRKIRALDTAVAKSDPKSSGILLFQKSMSPGYSTITGNAYNLTERLARYQDFQEMELSLHRETKIAVPGGFKTIEELANECSVNPDHRFIVYAYDHNKQQIVLALGKQARQTCVDVAYKVMFDNGKSITASGDHRLMLRDGSYRKTKELQPGDPMMPFYRENIFVKESHDEHGYEGYQWVYTMQKERPTAFKGKPGWVPEHRLVAEFVTGKSLNIDEVVHHKNFKKWDNDPKNLVVMTDADHKAYHTNIVNQKKWSSENQEWIEQFKTNHSAFMTENNPTKRHDITFPIILQVCDQVGFNINNLTKSLGTSMTSIRNRLKENGFDSFETFARAYQPGWRNGGWDNVGDKNPRYDSSLTTEDVLRAYNPEMSLNSLATTLNTTSTKILNRLKVLGYKSWSQFKSSYVNCKVVSVECVGEMPLYDLTVDGYKNFATDSVISHNTPEISSALDIYADESVSADDKGRALHVYSDNEKIKELLEDLFYSTLNVEFNLRSWARNLVKYGDLFLYNDVSPEHGVVNAFPIPVNEIEREENFDKNDPFAVRFRWVTLGNKVLENWEVSHFRLLGNDMFLPYGSSVIEPARRIWRQLILIEDAMLVYRVVRAPERRVFYIDVANLPPENVGAYVEEQRRILRTSQVIDKTTGRVDLRYNPLSVDEDYFIPIRGQESGTKIDTLVGGQNTANVEDVAYIQKKLFAALKIPRAYLGYDDMLSSKATLAQEDIRFSRTINVIQKTLVAELNKLAIIHLFAHGFDGDDLQNFTLRLSNPSTVAQQQKLELWRAKFEIAGTLPEGMGSKRFVQHEIWGLSEEEIDKMDEQRMEEKLFDAALEGAEPPEDDGMGGGGEDLFADDGGGGETPEGGDEELPPEENASDEFEPGDVEPGAELLTSSDDPEDEGGFKLQLAGDNVKPVAVKSQLKRALYNRSRRRTHGASKTHMPDLAKMTSNDNPAMQDPYDNSWLKSVVTNPLSEAHRQRVIPLSPDMIMTLARLKQNFESIRNRGQVSIEVISDGKDVQSEIEERLLNESNNNEFDSTDEVFTIDDESDNT